MAAHALSFNGNIAPAITGQYVPIVNGRRMAAGIPEVYIAKEIDNSRLVKVTDAKRQREIYMFSAVMTVVCTLMMLYVWQHFSSIQYGYRIEDQKASVERLQEENRALRLEEASLRDPERIDVLARRMGFAMPQVGQVQRLDNANGETGNGIVARASEFALVTVAR
jgi:cell division protein FtsL